MRSALTIAVVALLITSVACGRAVAQMGSDGNAAFAAQNYQGAIWSYERGLSRAPGKAEFLYNAGNAHYRLREFDIAQESYMSALAGSDNAVVADSLFNLGNAYFSNLQFDKAFEAYKEALRLNPDDGDAKHNLEVTLAQFQRSSPASEEEVEGESRDEPPQDPQEDDEQPEQQQPNEGEQEEEPPQDEQNEDSEIPELTEEQARQLLESVGRDTDTLRSHLQQVLIVQREPPSRDW